MLAMETHWSFVFGVVSIYGISQGLDGALALVGTEYCMKEVQKVQPSESQGPGFPTAEDVAEVKRLLEKEMHMRKEAEYEVNKLKSQLGQYPDSGAGGDDEILKLQKALEDEVHQEKKLEEEIIIRRSQMLQLTFEADQVLRL
ncbi:hypothetical protein REPUB_Repub17cG0026000 [Reevesia pubescens]